MVKMARFFVVVIYNYYDKRIKSNNNNNKKAQKSMKIRPSECSSPEESSRENEALLAALHP